MKWHDMHRKIKLSYVSLRKVQKLYMHRSDHFYRHVQLYATRTNCKHPFTVKWGCHGIKQHIHSTITTTVYNVHNDNTMLRAVWYLSFITISLKDVKKLEYHTTSSFTTHLPLAFSSFIFYFSLVGIALSFALALPLLLVYNWLIKFKWVC